MNKERFISEKMYNKFKNNSVLGNVVSGIILLKAGIIVFLDKYLINTHAAYHLQDWVVSSATFLIVLGLFIYARSGFNKKGSLIVSLVGLFMLFGKELHIPHFNQYVFPIVLVCVGVYFIFYSAKIKQRRREKFNTIIGGDPTETVIQSSAIFGGVEKSVESTNFKGGEIVSIFGGHEIDFRNCQLNGIVELQCTNIMGGTKIRVPSDWNVEIKMHNILGGIEDKRFSSTGVSDDKKVILVGINCMGGLEIIN